MRTFRFRDIPPHCVKSTRDRDLFGDPTQKYAVVDVRMDVERLVKVQVHDDDDEYLDDSESDALEDDTLPDGVDETDELGRPSEIERTERTKISLGPNPRAQYLKSHVSNEIRRSLLKRDGAFHRLNRGIVIVAKDVRYDNQTEELVWTEADEDRHGCVDGGHTLRIIDEVVGGEEWKSVAKAGPVRPQFVCISFLRGVDKENEGAEIAAARNTSLNVEESAIAHLQGAFDSIHASLSKYPDVQRIIAYKQFELKRPDKHIDVVQVLQCLTVLDNRLWSDDEQPYRAYWSRKKTVRDFLDKAHVENYRRLSALVPDALALREYIILNYETWYKRGRGKSGVGSTPMFGKTRERKSAKPTPLYVLPYVRKNQSKTANYELVTEALAMPILASLRAVVSHGKQAEWIVDDIYKFLDEIGPSLVDSLNVALRDKKNANAVLKDKNVWRTLYLQARVAAFEGNVLKPKSTTPSRNGGVMSHKSIHKTKTRKR